MEMNSEEFMLSCSYIRMNTLEHGNVFVKITNKGGTKQFMTQM